MLYFDIGANVGKWSLQNIDIDNCNKIIAIEASANVYDTLKANCVNNNIICLHYAVCDNNCNDVTFYEAAANTLSTINKEWLVDEKCRFFGEPYKEIQCPSITLDRLIELYGVPDLVKIDVEGGEYSCIKSLTSKTNALCFEWASETNHISFDCLDYLYQLGYNQFYVQYADDYKFRPDINAYYDIEHAKHVLSITTPKEHWGMIWCI